MDTSKAVTHVSLCAGYGGIDLGLKRAIPNLRTVAFSEIEGFACANLVAKMEAGLLDAAPIWTNLKTFPWSEFRGKVGVLSGGYPCQPFSAAGKRLGTEDPRHLWPFIADGIRLMQPRVCFFENVEGHISLGLRAVIEELGSMGYQVSWGIFSASEVGAPHQRKRIFILAHLIDERLQGRLCGRTHQEWKDINGYAGCGGAGGGSGLADSNSAGSRKDWKQSQLWTVRTEQSSSNCWNPESTKGNQGWPSRPGEHQYGWEPPRVVGNASRELLNGSGSGAGEDRCAKPANAGQWQAEPSLGRDADGTAGGLDYAELCISGDNRTDELRLLGNGVVPATATRAFLTLLKELNE